MLCICLLACMLLVLHVANPFIVSTLYGTPADRTSAISSCCTNGQLEPKHSLARMYICCGLWWRSTRRRVPSVLPRVCVLQRFSTLLCGLAPALQIWKNDESDCHRPPYAGSCGHFTALLIWPTPGTKISTAADPCIDTTTWCTDSADRPTRYTHTSRSNCRCLQQRYEKSTDISRWNTTRKSKT